MKLSRNFLADYVALDCDTATLCDKLTMAGIEVEAVEATGMVPDGVIVGKILERNRHPNADKLSVCKVFDGEKELQIVCGAPNCDAGKTVPVATIGTVFRTPDGEFKIKPAKLRGVESSGMMCSEKELGISDADDGLMELDATLKPGTPLQSIYKGDVRLDLEITQNRPDYLSHYGVARDVACLLDVEAKLPEVTLPEVNDLPANLITIEAPELCTRYSARLIRNVTVKESPGWLKERLLSVGLRPINNIVDVTNFVLMEVGHPLHAFDYDELEGHRIVVRRAAAGEKLKTLDGTVCELQPDNLVICDAAKPMALAGVMGGENSGVGPKTKNILLESAVFERSNIRSTARKFGFSTDASYRYERGVDYEMARYASDRAAQLILETAGGELASDFVDVRAKEPVRCEILCRFERVRSLIGGEIAPERMVDIFRKLGLGVEKITPDSCVVIPPTFRGDLEREADLAEEVARINGLDKIPLIPVVGKVVASERDDAYLPQRTLRNQMVDLGYYECYHYSMVSEKSALSDTRFAPKDLLKLTNPLSLEYGYMRPSLWGEMLGTVERNIARRNLTLRLFELGKAFCHSDLFPEERLELVIALSGLRHPERFSAERTEEFDFYDLKGTIEALLELRGITLYQFVGTDDARFVPGHAAELIIAGKSAGVLGQVAHKAVKSFRTTHKIFMAALDPAVLEQAPVKSMNYNELSTFPATSRDVAFAAPVELEHAAVIEFLRKAKIPDLEKIELFDIFSDEKLKAAGRKSMAYSMTFRRHDRTLTDAEVNASYELIRSKLAKGLGVELR